MAVMPFNAVIALASEVGCRQVRRYVTGFVTVTCADVRKMHSPKASVNKPIS